MPAKRKIADEMNMEPLKLHNTDGPPLSQAIRDIYRMVGADGGKVNAVELSYKWLISITQVEDLISYLIEARYISVTRRGVQVIKML
jgi:hypothetical protein